MATADVDPGVAAEQLLSEHDEDWIERLAAELSRRLGARGLGNVARTWHLSLTALGEMFGVSRQAASKWLKDGVPPDRATQVADVEAVAELLERHLKPERVPAVVRRRSPGLGGESLISMISGGHSAEALELTREMFSFGDAHR